MKRYTSLPEVPKPVGPYSIAVEANGFYFLSGIIPLKKSSDTNDYVIPEKFSDQLKQVFENLKAALTSLGLDKTHVVKVTIFLTDLNTFSELNAFYENFFEKGFPSRTTVEVSRLPKNAQIELDCICCKHT